MAVKYTIESMSDLDLKLEDEFEDESIHTDEWESFLEAMPGVIRAEYTGDTVIEFESEEHKNWFLLKWS